MLHRKLVFSAFAVVLLLSAMAATFIGTAVATPKLTVNLAEVQGPTANFVYSPDEPVANGTITFNASSSLPGWNGTHNTPIVSYAWNFSDGTPVVTEADPIITHIFTAEDDYTVTLNVTDSQGLWNATSKTVFVYQHWTSEVNVIPSAPNVLDEVDVNLTYTCCSMPPSVTEFGNLTQVGNTFSVNVSISDHGGARIPIIIKYSHTYHLRRLPPGSYQFEVYVKYQYESLPEDYWLEKNVSFTVASLGPTPPKARFTYSPPKQLANETITFDASASEPAWNGTHILPILNYTWNFDDGNTTTVADPIITHNYTADATYTVTLNVTTDQSFWNTTSKQITIGPQGPTANFTYYLPPQPFADGITTVFFNATLSEPGWNGSDTPIVSYEWSFGDGTPNVTEADPITTHNFTQPGNYTVTLNVTDTQGLWDTASQTVEVLNILQHDVAVTNIDVKVTPSDAHYSGGPMDAPQCYPEWKTSYTVNVTVTNEGNTTESFTVTLFLQNSTGNYTKGTQQVNNLAPGATTNLIFSFPVPPLPGYAGPGSGPAPAAWPYPTYTVWANASILPGEMDTADNELFDGLIVVSWPGDIARAGDGPPDGLIGGPDLFFLARSWYKNAKDHPRYPPTLGGYDYRADFNMDGRVDGQDLFILAKMWFKGPRDG